MYEKEEALPGEIEIETVYGSLLGHVDEEGDIVLTTGLDADRLMMHGRRVLAHAVISQDGEPLQAAIMRAEDHLYATDEQYDAFLDVCRKAVAGIEFDPPSDDEASVSMRFLRRNGGSLIVALASEESERREFEAAHDKAPDVDLVYPSRVVETEWGPVRLDFSAKAIDINAGDGLTPPLSVPGKLFGRTRIVLRDAIPAQSAPTSLPKPEISLRMSEEGTRRPIDPYLARRITSAVIAEARKVVSADPEILVEAAQAEEARNTARIRDELILAAKITSSLWQERAECKQRLEPAASLGP